MQTHSYPDFWIRLIGSLFLAHFIKILGYTISLWEIVLQANYFPEVLLGGLINFGVWTAIRWVSIRLDERYDWQQQPLLRAFLQAAAGFVAPMLLSFFTMYVFFGAVVKESIFDSTWLYVEYRVVLFYLAMMNLYYLGYYFYQRFRQLEQELSSHKIHPPSPVKVEPQTSSAGVPLIIASKGARQVPVPTDEIAYCFLQNEIYYLKTFDEQQLMATQTLDELATILPSNQFFRINRQILANARACASFRSIANGKLEVTLLPPLPEAVIISQKKAAAFKQWLVNP